MVDICANPGCDKLLHYLREGRVFVFAVAIRDAATGLTPSHRLEHYWLCGECSRSRIVRQDAAGSIQVVAKLRNIRDAWRAELPLARTGS